MQRMDIKIKCTAAEFGDLVRACSSLSGIGYCTRCPLIPVCVAHEGDEMSIDRAAVTFELVEDGAADG